MDARESATFLAGVAARVNAAGAAVDGLVASDDPEASYAATTAALHVHAAQAELAAFATTDAPAPADPGASTPGEAADALADVVALVNDRSSSLPPQRRAAAARVTLDLAEARDALRGAWA